MMEVIDPSAVPSPPASRRRTALYRRHAINLCCAQSVAAMVEEIARQLRGLGFDASVSCGAQARAALLGGEAFTQRPTIHVVCVQGSMQERVVKPLRQALATHGGEGQHLFVAVLDLSVPLTMVGHIRRFAEALERTPAAPIRVRDHLGDRRRWREHFGHRELAERPTKSHPIVVDRLASGPRPIVRATREARQGPRTIGTRSRPVRIVPTAKNRQVTAPQAIVDLSSPRRPTPPAGVGALPAIEGARSPAPARRIPAPSLRFPPPPGSPPVEPAREPTPVAPPVVTPVAPPVATPVAPPVATHIGAVADAIVAAHEAVKAQVAETRQRVEAAVLADAAPTADTTDGDVQVQVQVQVREPPSFASPSSSASDLDVLPPRRRVWPVAIGVVLVGLGAIGWSVRDRWLPAVAAEGRAAAPVASHTPVAPGDDATAPEAAALADARRTASTREQRPAPDDDTPPTDREAAEPVHEDAAEPSGSVAGSASAGGVEARLDDAVARHRLIEVSNLYVTRKRGSATSWGEARARCNAFRFDGIDGWRLPWRRELKLIGVSTRLEAGTYWSHSAAEDRRGAAWAWHTSTRKLATASKRDTTAEVVCVKPQVERRGR